MKDAEEKPREYNLERVVEILRDIRHLEGTAPHRFFSQLYQQKLKESLDIVVGGYIVKDNQLLLIHHKKLNKWLPPGGHIDPGETPDDALRREVKEELGIDVDFAHYPFLRRGNDKELALPFYANRHHISGEHYHYCLFYLLEPKSDDIRIKEEEVLGYEWVRDGEELLNLFPPLSAGDIENCLEALDLAGLTK